MQTRPPVGWCRGTDENFYGTIVFGGSQEYGAIYQITPGGSGGRKRREVHINRLVGALIDVRLTYPFLFTKYRPLTPPIHAAKLG